MSCKQESAAAQVPSKSEKRQIEAETHEPRVSVPMVAQRFAGNRPARP